MMRRYLWSSALLVALASSLLVPAQAPPRPAPARMEDPHQLVRGWYRQFLDRDAEREGLGTWVRELGAGTDPAAVLATILASDEYYLRAGRTPEAFVRALLVDLTGREPDPQEVRKLASQVTRPEARRDVAHAILQRHPQAILPPAEPAVRDFLASVREQTRNLIAEVERLQEDIVAELDGLQERELYRRADAVLGDLRHFQRAFRVGATREHLAKDFEQLDRKLHALLKEVQNLGPRHRALQRAAHRVEQADQGLHATLAHVEGSGERPRELVKRHVHTLLAEVREFERTARYALANDRGGVQSEKSIREFAHALEHFHKSLEGGESRRHLREDYVDVDRAWKNVVEHLNVLPPTEGHRHLRSRAQRIDNLEESLRRLVGMTGERGRIVIQYGRSR